jgi:phosphomannomutase
VVVSRAAAGLAGYLHDQGLSGTPVVIGFDARHNSDVFARDTAEIMAGAGLEALVCPRPLPTPVLAAAILTYRASAGVVVTASHNPPQDNGYKVYLGDGCQIVPPADVQIADRIAAVGPIADLPRSAAYRTLDEEVVDRYLARVCSLPLPGGPREVAVAYTAMHGVGSPLMRAALTGAGFPAPLAVSAQDAPDPDFPTVAFPNPEEPGAMDLALDLAGRAGVDVVLANDPDADRCAVAIPAPGGPGYRMLTGDEVGALLGWWILQRGQRSGRGVVGTFANSIVSSQLLGAIARSAGLGFRETLTGFKWIARAADDLVFGYEEALGYCVDPAGVRDKDGISAGLLFAEMVAVLKAEGRSVPDVLDELAVAHGVHATSQVSLRFTDLDRIPALMASLRADPPTWFGGLGVVDSVDLEAGSADLPPTDGLRYLLGGAEGVAGARVIVRPSGTEPKVKAYLEVRAPVGPDGVGPARRAAADRLAAVAEDVRARLS